MSSTPDHSGSSATEELFNFHFKKKRLFLQKSFFYKFFLQVFFFFFFTKNPSHLHEGVLEVRHEGALELADLLADVVQQDALDQAVLAQVERALDRGQGAVDPHVRRRVAQLRLKVTLDLKGEFTGLLQQLPLL